MKIQKSFVVYWPQHDALEKSHIKLTPTSQLKSQSVPLHLSWAALGQTCGAAAGEVITRLRVARDVDWNLGGTFPTLFAKAILSMDNLRAQSFLYIIRSVEVLVHPVFFSLAP